MVRTADFSALTRGIFEGLLWGQIQPFAETCRAEGTANQSASNQQLPFLLVIAAKSAQNLTPSRKNIFLPDASEPPGVVESFISVLANGFLPRTWRRRRILYGQRSGPRAAFRTGWQQAPRMRTILLQFKSRVNVVLYKHVCYTNLLHYH
jgi:hypothetical protein